MGAAIMIIGVILMIVIHEGGHFVAAKAFGMKATEAFFGFGPRIWSMTRGETEYGVKAIPFGGYVRIIGMNPFEEVDPDDEGRTYRAAPFWKKTVVVLAGIMSHFVVALVLLWFVATVGGSLATDADGEVMATTVIAGVSEYLPDTTEPSPAAIADARRGDDIVAVDGVRIVEADVTNREQMHELTRDVDVIFHLAISCLRTSLHTPYLSHDTNAGGTLAVCLAARENKVGAGEPQVDCRPAFDVVLERRVG